MWLLSSFFIVAGLTEGLEILDPLPTTLRNSNFVVELESSYIIARGATKSVRSRTVYFSSPQRCTRSLCRLRSVIKAM